MRTLLALAALALAAALPSCAQRSGTKPTTATKQPPVTTKPRTVSTIPIHTFPTDTALVFQRTPCYGTCPSYTATVFRNGRVEYFGDRSVPVLGKRTLSLPPATVAAMLDEARRINFGAFQPQYLGNVSDLPGTIVAVYLPGQRAHRVEAVHDMPEGLTSYIAYLRGRLDPLAGLNVEK